MGKSRDTGRGQKIGMQSLKQDTECSPQGISAVQKSVRKAALRPSSQGATNEAATSGTGQAIEGFSYQST